MCVCVCSGGGGGMGKWDGRGAWCHDYVMVCLALVWSEEVAHAWRHYESLHNVMPPQNKGMYVQSCCYAIIRAQPLEMN